MKSILIFILAFTLLPHLGVCQHARVQKHEDADAEHQRQANEYYEKINTLPYSTYYGGSYISAKGQLMVYIVGDMAKGSKNVAKDIGSNNFIAIPGKFSYKTLNKIMDDLNAFNFNKANDAISGNFNLYGLMGDKNQITVELDDFSEEKITEFRKYVVDSPAIYFVKSAGRIIED